jgi:EAL domain-containing protein (putative c-di-GMP-specific phosphodiesterase class I)
MEASGARIAIDDTCSGFASLRHILRFEPDIIKLDRDLCQGINADPLASPSPAASPHLPLASARR